MSSKYKEPSPSSHITVIIYSHHQQHYYYYSQISNKVKILERHSLKYELYNSCMHVCKCTHVNCCILLFCKNVSNNMTRIHNPSYTVDVVRRAVIIIAALYNCELANSSAQWKRTENAIITIVIIVSHISTTKKICIRTCNLSNLLLISYQLIIISVMYGGWESRQQEGC